MRVIAGNAKGTTLLAPKGFHTRPTTDRVKETLFNILQPNIPQCCFLDLFAGSGAIGIEALSRSAREVVFVDSCKESLKTIQANLEKTRLTKQARLLELDVFIALSRLQTQKCLFDIIFMDPPYQSHLAQNVLKQTSLLLSSSGMIVVEMEANDPLPSADELFSYGLVLSRTKTFGRTNIFFLIGCES